MTPTSPRGQKRGQRSSSTSKSSTTTNVVTRRWGTFPQRSTNSPKTLNLLSTFRGELQFDTEISRAVAIPHSQQMGQSIFQMGPAHKVAEEYRQLAREIESRIKEFRAKIDA